MAQAAAELPPSVDPEPVNEDWMIQFINLSQDVSQEEVQIIWSKLLAGEVAQPGRFSLRTLHLVKTLGKEDALLFSHYCNYVFSIDYAGILGRILSVEAEGYVNRKGLDVIGLNHLKNLGLVSEPTLHLDTRHAPNPFPVSYFNRSFLLKKRNKALSYLSSFLSEPVIDIEPLTDVGQQLFSLSEAEQDDDYLKVVLGSLKSHRKVEPVTDKL
jgi:hypothetical protein